MFMSVFLFSRDSIFIGLSAKGWTRGSTSDWIYTETLSPAPPQELLWDIWYEEYGKGCCKVSTYTQTDNTE
jgi:hypothetical protein